jgi:hypothetical protein
MFVGPRCYKHITANAVQNESLRRSDMFIAPGLTRLALCRSAMCRRATLHSTFGPAALFNRRIQKRTRL